MLAKQFRLIKNKDFENVWKKGKSFFLPELGIKTAMNNLTVFRFGFIVSTKISKKAVVRNKIKRRLREITRKNLLNIIQGYDYVLVARPGIEKLNFEQLEKIFKEIFKGLNKLKK